MIKNITRSFAQKLLGFDLYLFLFSRFTIFRILFLRHEKEFHYFLKLIPPGGAILDIGANIGMMTVVLAKKFPSSSIYAFEPVPANAKALKRVLHFYHLGHVKIYETALSDRDGEIKMIMPFSGNSKMQGLSHVTTQGDETKEHAFTVACVELDHIDELQQAEKISAVKIDVENFEYYVLMGGKRLLQKHRPVILCELWNDERRLLCIQLMQEMNYRVKILENGQLVDFNGQQALDFFFLP